jgi:hypothetical protein
VIYLGIKVFHQQFCLSPDLLGPLLNSAICLNRASQIAQAEEVLTQVTACFPNRPDGHELCPLSTENATDLNPPVFPVKAIACHPDQTSDLIGLYSICARAGESKGLDHAVPLDEHR